MIDGIPKISVLIITYKQEKLISRALDALIAQKDYLYEICVSDDCSPDSTWEILQAYKKKYSDFVKIHRNGRNLGIFENIEMVYTMPTGDVVNLMAGDDEPGKGWFRSVVEYIQEKNIDYKNELFCIYGDHLILYANGDCRRARNTAIDKHPKDAIRLSLRGMISNRGCSFSIGMLKLFDKVSQGRAYYVEMAQDRQIQIHATNNYYIPEISNVYYARIGVSTHINEDSYKKSRLYLEEILYNKGIKVTNSDRFFNKYIMARGDFRKYRRFISFVKLIWYKLLSIDFSLPFDKEGLRQLIFAIMRRIPHTNPIIFN